MQKRRWYYDILFSKKWTEGFAEEFFQKHKQHFRNVTVRTTPNGRVHGYAQVTETAERGIDMFDEDLRCCDGVEQIDRGEKPVLGVAPRISEAAALAGMERGCEGFNEEMGCSNEPPPGEGDPRYWLYSAYPGGD